MMKSKEEFVTSKNRWQLPALCCMRNWRHSSSPIVIAVKIG